MKIQPSHLKEPPSIRFPGRETIQPDGTARARGRRLRPIGRTKPAGEWGLGVLRWALQEEGGEIRPAPH